jgi:hypothetical protein
MRRMGEWTWEDALREAAKLLAASEDLRGEAKVGALNDAVGHLLGVVTRLAESTLAQTPDPDIGLP